MTMCILCQHDHEMSGYPTLLYPHLLDKIMSIYKVAMLLLHHSYLIIIYKYKKHLVLVL